MQLWRKDLAKINPKAAESLADPGPYPNLFPNLDWALQAEKLQVRTRPGAHRPATLSVLLNRPSASWQLAVFALVAACCVEGIMAVASPSAQALCHVSLQVWCSRQRSWAY